MIQRLTGFDSPALGALLRRLAQAFILATVALSCACGGPSAQAIPRTLQGATLRGAFVPPSAYEAFVRGELALANGRPHEAVAQLELATTAPDEDAYLLSRLASAQLRAGDPRAAEQTLARAGELDPCSEAVWLARGELAAHRDDDGAVRTAFAKASACAPGSDAGALALSTWLAQRGDLVASLDVLIDAAEGPRSLRSQHALARSLREANPVTLAHGLASLGGEHAPKQLSIERAIALAMERGQPRLALRLRERHAARLPAALEASLLAANGLREELAALVARNDARELGGPARAAALALEAGAYERAQLESQTALAEAPSDALHALHARASIALGDTRSALTDARAIGQPALRQTIVGEALAALGAPALGRELANAARRGDARP